ncbi:MAG: universal stress protein [Bacteroidetes bacterium]|jgi:nucleotide-binding universal stress UspA family protein|nr:universal stress protein [Bacteroidota bacterium]
MIAPRHLLVPTDLSPFSFSVLKYALEIADLFSAQLTVLHVVDRHAEHVHQTDGERERSARAAVDVLLHQAGAEGRPIGVVLRHGPAVSEIVKAARDLAADLIVMCTHGRTGMRHVLVGSVAEKVVRLSPCPVLTMRPEEFREIVGITEDDVAGDLHLSMPE